METSLAINQVGEAVRELNSDTYESYDLKVSSKLTTENEEIPSKNSLKSATVIRDKFQSISSRPLGNEFSDGLGGGKNCMVR